MGAAGCSFGFLCAAEQKQVESSQALVLSDTKMTPILHSCVCQRWLSLMFAVLSLLGFSSCMQAPAEPGSTFCKGLQRSAWKTLESYNQAVLSGKEKMRAEIPANYWETGISKLKPVRVYSHHVNLVVVQGVQNGQEHGKYIYLPVSSYLPVSRWFSHQPQDGYLFRPAVGAGVYNFTHTAAR